MKRQTVVLLLALIIALVWITGAGIFWYFELVWPPLGLPASQLTAVGNRGVESNALPELMGGAPLKIARTVWRSEVQELVAAPIVVGGQLYLAAGKSSAAGRVLALDAASGKLIWEVRLNSITDQGPTIAGDLIYVGTRNGKLSALDRHTGAMRWSFQGQTAIIGRPLVQAGVLYVGAEALYALDALTGTLRWRYEPGNRVVQPLAYADGILAALSADQDLFLLNTWNGKPRLRFPLWFNPLGGPVIEGDTVAVTGDGANVQVLALFDRDIPLEKTVRFWWSRLWLYGLASRPPLPPGYRWQQRNLGGVIGRIIASDGERFYLSIDDPEQRGRLAALENQSGALLWELSLPSLITPGAANWGNTLVIGTTTPMLMGIDRVSGRLLWQEELPSALVAAPVFFENQLFIPLANGVLQVVKMD